MAKTLKMSVVTPSPKNLIEILVLDVKDLQMQYARILALILNPEAAEKFNSCNKILSVLEKLKLKTL
jgi:hypothetical protein